MFYTLISFGLFEFTKCQNEKCRQKTQNRVSDDTFHFSYYMLSIPPKKLALCYFDLYRLLVMTYEL